MRPDQVWLGRRHLTQITRDQQVQNKFLRTRDDAEGKINPAPIANKLTALVRPEMSSRSDQLKIGIIIKKMPANFFLSIDKLPIT